jgi:hypothetical protein
MLGFGNVQEVYERVVTGEDERRRGLTWPGMQRALSEAASQDLVDRVINDVPSWPAYPGHMVHGSPGWLTSTAWFRYVAMALDAGYYGLLGESSDGAGPLKETDHWVLLVGARATWKPAAVAGARSLCTEILTSCSRRGENWFEAAEYLKRRGGFNVLLARPTA